MNTEKAYRNAAGVTQPDVLVPGTIAKTFDERTLMLRLNALVCELEKSDLRVLRCNDELNQGNPMVYKRLTLAQDKEMAYTLDVMPEIRNDQLKLNVFLMVVDFLMEGPMSSADVASWNYYMLTPKQSFFVLNQLQGLHLVRDRVGAYVAMRCKRIQLSVDAVAARAENSLWQSEDSSVFDTEYQGGGSTNGTTLALLERSSFANQFEMDPSVLVKFSY